MYTKQSNGFTEGAMKQQSENSHMNVQESERNYNASEILKIDKVEDSGLLTVVTVDKDKGFISIGEKRISSVKLIDTIREDIMNKEWYIIEAMVIVLTEGVCKKIAEDKIV